MAWGPPKTMWLSHARFVRAWKKGSRQSNADISIIPIKPTVNLDFQTGVVHVPSPDLQLNGKVFLNIMSWELGGYLTMNATGKALDFNSCKTLASPVKANQIVIPFYSQSIFKLSFNVLLVLPSLTFHSTSQHVVFMSVHWPISNHILVFFLFMTHHKWWHHFACVALFMSITTFHLNEALIHTF